MVPSPPARPPTHPPLPAAHSIRRPPLIARLESASSARLVTLLAPVGSGKTTLLAQWYQQLAPERAVAWYPLEPCDNDLQRFSARLADALFAALPGLEMPALAAVEQVDEAARGQALAAALLKALGSLGHALWVLLDDVQHLSHPDVRALLHRLVHAAPDNVHWVMCGRQLPDIDTASLILNDQRVDIAAHELAFDLAQVQRLGRSQGPRGMSRAQYEAVLRRSQGWVAGVKLGLRVAGDNLADDGLAHFDGAHQQIADYLDHAVLQALPPPLQDFLVACSVVDQISGDLCNALLDTRDGQMQLEQTWRGQLFLQAQDDHVHWFRFHPLFLGYLRGRLRRDGARMQQLHDRASRWFADNRRFEEALHHAFAGSDTAWRIEVLTRFAGTWRETGDVAGIAHWCERLAREDVLAHPPIAFAYVACLSVLRRMDEARTLLDTLREQAAAGRPLEAEHLRVLHWVVQLLGDSDSCFAFDDAEPAGRRESDVFVSGLMLTLRAYNLLRSHQFDPAWRLATRARDILGRGNSFVRGMAGMAALLAERGKGQFGEIMQRAEHTAPLVRARQHNAAWTLAAVALGHVRYEENRLPESEALCAEVVAHLDQGSTFEGLSIAYLVLARIRASQMRVPEALQLLDYAHSLLEGGRHQRFLMQVCAEKLRLCLAMRKTEAAQAVAVEMGLPALVAAGAWDEPRPYDECWDFQGLAHSMQLMHRREYAACRQVLHSLRHSAEALGYAYRAAPLGAALAAACWAEGDHGAAFDALNRALGWTHAQGFSRSVFDHVPLLVQILAVALAHGRVRHALPSAYVRRFESVLKPEPLPELRSAAGAPRATASEKLTERELKTLKLLARGLSNQQISEESQIALSTVKWHVKNLFAKLGVSTRIGAAARARALQLID